MMRELTEHGEGADYRFVVDGAGRAVLTRGVASAKQVRVPARLGGHPVVALGEECFASAESGGLSLKTYNGQLECVALPEGVTRIGRAAFRGCSRLSTVELPDSLEEVGDLAFSCTSVGSLRIPRACTRLSGLALRTGPESLAGAGCPYLSKLDAIEVDSANPTYCAVGGALCRRLEAGGLEAMLCPGKAGELRLGFEVTRVAPSAFAGTYEVGTLAFSERVGFEDGCGLAPQAACEQVEIELVEHAGDSRRLALAMPSRELQRRVFESTRGLDAFDLDAFLAAYDEALLEEPDRLLQSKLLVARLARPVLLSASTRDAYRKILDPLFDALCVQFGARSYWRGFEDMADAGLLDPDSATRAVAVLTARSDAAAAAYVLQLKRSRFGESGWDYGL